MGACWPWQGSINNGGYGQVRVNKRVIVAHRVAYVLTFGAIPDGLQVDHVKARGCVMRSCCNPWHLEAVTAQVNILRSNGMAARHAVKTHCPAGHAYGSENTELYGGRRYCRECQRVNNRAYRARKAVSA